MLRLLGALILSFPMAWVSPAAGGSAQSGKESELISGEFELIEHSGRVVSKSSYDGRFRLVFFGFTNCPDICPTTMYEVAEVMKHLGDQAEQLQPLFISIDHGNDTVERISTYVAAFHPDIRGLTGSEDQIRRAAEGFNATYGLGRDYSAGSVTDIYHSSYLYLMDREGEFLDLFGYGTPAERIASKIRRYLD